MYKGTMPIYIQQQQLQSPCIYFAYHIIICLNKYTCHITHVYPITLPLQSTYRPHITTHITEKAKNIMSPYCFSNKYAFQCHIWPMCRLLNVYQWETCQSTCHMQTCCHQQCCDKCCPQMTIMMPDDENGNLALLHKLHLAIQLNQWQLS